MPLLQPKLNLRVAQRQVLTPGLMQMVSVLALNKLELKEMIDAEMVENPVLEEIDESVPMLDEVAGKEELLDRRLERGADGALEHRVETEPQAPAKDSFNEVDFGSYFQEYLDPGFRTQQEYEENEKPSFENFLSQPTTLSDHLAWQLGSLKLEPELDTGAEFVIGNLDEDGYLVATEDELVASFYEISSGTAAAEAAAGNGTGTAESDAELNQTHDLVRRAIDLVQHMDPAGVAARDLRECLLIQIGAQQHEFSQLYARRHVAETATETETEIAVEAEEEADAHGSIRAEAEAQLEQRRRAMEVAAQIVDSHLQLLQKRDIKDLAKAVRASPDEVHAAVEFIRTLDPRPGRLYNREQTRLIEPDVVFVKRGGEWVVSMNEEDLPSLRLSRRYRQMLMNQNTEREVKEYVKERFRSAMQLMRNIAQRKSTILRTCEVIVRRQQDFLDQGIEALRPMMIKEVAEEIGVHPSTISRAVANKYAHTPQGVIELRFFFSEGANGPEGADTPLLVLKRKVRKFIEDEDSKHPLTDDQLAAMLQAQGIQLTRRTVAKYREDMNIPSTHQRRKRD
ncbi:MAG TPA: RNA polymerase sigma-54 factor [Terracidiphilus sp.]|jgi:RNA polymerase sigma-54 factor|nr:RNA polymerase sigma-54 factor [Terracidiphilus sp.]